MILHIRHMVCQRCIRSIDDVITRLGWPVRRIGLGEVETGDDWTEDQISTFAKEIQPLGFELVDSRRNRLIVQIRNEVLNYLAKTEEAGERPANLSDFLTAVIPYDYSYLSDLFSSVEGITVEQYYIRQRIEKVKEYLVYDDWTLTEIAYRMGYSSVHHLSAQFRKVTGMTPSRFKMLGSNHRKGLDGT